MSIMEKVFITPSLALQWISAYAPKRTLSDTRISQYALDMQNGNWRENGATIVFDKQGCLIDGQHRLHAFLRSGLPRLEAFVFYGADNLAQDTIDTGRPRTAALKIKGFKNPAIVAGAARLCLLYESGLSMRTPTSFSTPVIVDWIASHSVIYDHAPKIAARKGPFRVSAALAIACLTTNHRWKEFYEGIQSGENLSHGDPRLSLRRWREGRSRAGMPSGEFFLGIGRAWNSYVQGRALSRICPSETGHIIIR